MNDKTAKKLKKDFPIFQKNKKLVYLDNAATSQNPKQVIKALKKFYESSNANAGRGVYSLSEKAKEIYEGSRKIVADFIGSDFDEIIFTKSTTDSINFLSYTLDSVIGKGKNEIVLTEMEHHSNLVPWQEMAKRKKMKLKFIQMKDDFTLDMGDAKKKITNKTAVVAFTHVSNSLGVVNPVKNIVELAKKKNAISVVDAAQSVPHMKVDVKKLDCDFLAFSGHKTLGPMGIGVLYGKKEILEKLRPFEFGGGMIKKVTYENAEWDDVPERFEAGTQNVADAVGFAEGLKYLSKIGIENVEKREKELMEYALKKIKEIEGVEVYVNEKNYSGILSFNLDGIHSHDVASLLDDYGVCVRAGHHCNMPLMTTLGIRGGGTVRISFYLYNTFEDVDRLIEGLKKVKEKFGL